MATRRGRALHFRRGLLLGVQESLKGRRPQVLKRGGEALLSHDSTERSYGKAKTISESVAMMATYCFPFFA